MLVLSTLSSQCLHNVLHRSDPIPRLTIALHPLFMLPHASSQRMEHQRNTVHSYIHARVPECLRSRCEMCAPRSLASCLPVTLMALKGFLWPLPTRVVEFLCLRWHSPAARMLSKLPAVTMSCFPWLKYTVAGRHHGTQFHSLKSIRWRCSSPCGKSYICISVSYVSPKNKKSYVPHTLA